jgi:coenzyme PQQ precursor peptide PqqA
MKEPRQHWERPNFEEHPLGAEVTAYLTSPTTPNRK